MCFNALIVRQTDDRGRKLSACNDTKTAEDKFREIVNSVIERESHIKEEI